MRFYIKPPYKGVKNSLGDKVVITGSAAVLLHALNAETEENYNELPTLEKLVSIVKLEEKEQQITGLNKNLTKLSKKYDNSKKKYQLVKDKNKNLEK